MLWHNFYCPTGGHLLRAEVAESPWGHVTGESPLPFYLNKKRPEEIRQEFEQRFKVLRVVGASENHTLADEPGFTPEGAELLTETWRKKLPGLSDALLTTRGYLLQASKD